MQTVGEGRHEQGGHDQKEQRRIESGFLWIEALGAVAQAAGHEGASQHQQDVAEHGSDQGGLDHVDKPLVQGEEGHEQLWEVAEGRLQHPGRPGAEALTDLFDGLSDQSGHGCQGQTGQDEAGDIRCADGDGQAGDGGESHRRGQGDSLGLLERSQVNGSSGHRRPSTVAARGGPDAAVSIIVSWHAWRRGRVV